MAYLRMDTAAVATEVGEICKYFVSVKADVASAGALLLDLRHGYCK